MAPFPSKLKQKKEDDGPTVPISRIFTYLTMFDRFELFMATVGMAVSSANNLMMPTIIGRALNRSITGSFCTQNRSFILGVLGIFGLGSFFGWLRVYCFGHVASKVELKLKQDLYKSILSQEVHEVQETPSGKFFNIMSKDAAETASLFSKIIPNFFRSLNSMIGGAVMLFLLSPRLTMLTTSVVPIIGASAILFSKFVGKLKSKEREQYDKVMSRVQERINNILTVHQFGVQDNEAKQFRQNLNEIYPLTSYIISADGVFMGSLSFLFYSSVVVILFLGGSLLKSGTLTTGSLSSFALYSGMVGLGSSLFSTVVGNYSSAKRSMGRVFEIIDSTKTDSSSGITLSQIKGKCSFKNVYFQYPKSYKKIFQNFSFDINAGETVAITGVSGIGKTTLFNFLTKVYSPDRGCVEIDGTDISKFNTKWMLNSVIGVVNQENTLFAGTIKENIKFGMIEATDKDVENAAKLANANDFISELENGYNTQVGQQGYTLSSGQKQRICLARAIIKNPPILLLDEATSALDGESEKAVHTALESVMKGRTVVMISHREPTLKFANRILFMKEGGFYTFGTYTEMLNEPEFCQILDTPTHG